MRLIIVVADLELGGSQIAAVQLARALAERGHEVQLAARPSVDDQGADTGSLPFTALPPVDAIPSRIRQLVKSFREFEPDLVLTIEVSTVLTTLAAARLANVATAAYVLGPRIPWYLPDDLHVFVAMPTLREFSQKWRDQTTHLLLPPVRLDPANGADRSGTNLDGVLSVLAISRLVEPYKGAGLVALIKSIELLPNGELTIVGDGPFRQRLETEARQVNERLGRLAVTFVGADPDPRWRFEAASVIAGSGMTVIEAAATGLPSVVLGRDGFAAPVSDRNLDSLVASAFYGAGGTFDDPRKLAELISMTAEASGHSGVADRLRAIYSPDVTAESFLDELENIELRVEPFSSIGLAFARKADYRLRRRLILEVERRRIADVDELGNIVNRRMREHPLRNSVAR